MRIKVIVSVFILFVVLCIQNVSVAQNPTYALTAKNFDRTAPDSLTFEVYDFTQMREQFLFINMLSDNTSSTSTQT